LYRTTRDFLIQFGLSGLRDLPTLKEFEELAQAGLEGIEIAAQAECEPAIAPDSEPAPAEPGAAPPAAASA
ncbi:MAG: hypothetical protein ACRD1L_10035, partial [Terriglobales bacterium]